jgi:hypothetical protein
MQESCTYGSVRGAPSNGCPYRDRCALIAKGAALVAPPDSVVSGGSLKLPYKPQWVGGPATARGLTHREDRSAQLERGPENLNNRAAANWIHTYRAPPEPIGVDRRCSGRSQWHAERSFHVVDQIL